MSAHKRNTLGSSRRSYYLVINLLSVQRRTPVNQEGFVQTP